MVFPKGMVESLLKRDGERRIVGLADLKLQGSLKKHLVIKYKYQSYQLIDQSKFARSFVAS